MRKLYLHVGIHRTGTTSTQRFLKDNFVPLLTKGYLYPFRVKRHDGQIRRLVKGEMSVHDFALDLERRADSQQFPINSIVISDEDMSLIQDFSLFAGLDDMFDVKVVVSLRRQDLWLESWYLQNIKWQWNPGLAHLSFAEFFKRRADFFWIDYAERLAEYEYLFGAGCVVAGVFEREDMPEGPIQAFLRMIGIEDLSGFGPFVHRNSSLSALMSEFMRQMPMDSMDDPERTLFEAACIEVDQTLVTNGSKLVMPLAQRVITMADYAESNRLTAQRYIGRDTLFREPLPDAAEPLADQALPERSQEVLERFVGPVFQNLAKLMTTNRLAREKATRDAQAKPGAVKKVPGEPPAKPAGDVPDQG